MKTSLLLSCVQYRYCFANCLQSIVVQAPLVYFHHSIVHSFIHFSSPTSTGKDLLIDKTEMIMSDTANKLENAAMLFFTKCSGNITDDKAGYTRRAVSTMELADGIGDVTYSQTGQLSILLLSISTASKIAACPGSSEIVASKLAVLKIDTYSNLCLKDLWDFA